MSENCEGNKTCRTCRWWKPSGMFRETLPVGECRAKSPRTFQRNDETARLMTRWPMTVSLDFCGQHQGGRGQAQGAGSGEQGGGQ